MVGPLRSRSWSALLTQLIAGTDLDSPDTSWAMDQVMSGQATPAQVAAFVVALRIKGETPAEIAGLAAGMLSHACRVHVPQRAVDVVGTGGDQAHTVNISTMAALVTAAAGAPVVKHGNRAASSKCGAADVLEALGVVIDLGPEQVAQCVAEAGIGFCFAPVFHPAMRQVAGVRREIGISTAFNFLGPLTNPAQPGTALVGCADLRMAPVIARVLADREVSALVVRGDDGLDEITTTTTTSIWVVEAGGVRRDQLDPAELGVPVCRRDDLRGGDAAANADAVRRLLAGDPGPVRDAVLLNAAAALVAYHGLTGDLRNDLSVMTQRAAKTIDSGAAAALLERWVSLTNTLSTPQHQLVVTLRSAMRGYAAVVWRHDFVGVRIRVHLARRPVSSHAREDLPLSVTPGGRCGPRVGDSRGWCTIVRTACFVAWRLAWPSLPCLACHQQLRPPIQPPPQRPIRQRPPRKFVR
jgi:anthranilate phosphoribosyltransferase